MNDKHPPHTTHPTPQPDYSAEWALLQEGDSAAWDTLYKKGFEYALSKIFNKNWSFDDKKLIFQDAYDKLVDKVFFSGDFKIASKPLNTLEWILKYKYLEYERNKQKDLPPPPDPHKEGEGGDDQEALETMAIDCFHGLSERERRLLEMAIFENQLHEQIAQALGCSIGYVKVWRHRCMEKIRNCIKKKQKSL